MRDIIISMEAGRFVKVLREECRLPATGLVLVGVSGGPDSLCLLDAFQRAGQPLVAAHFDHGLRPESAEDALQVAGLARALGVPFVTARQEVGELAVRDRLSIEEAARAARYRFLFEQARLYQAQAVAVAHTADDQVETVLMHLLRGSGLDGLKGMTFRGILPAWDGQIPIIRPLLGTWRVETEAWCQEHGLEPILDASNLDTRFFRNRLRHELIPDLQTYNPRVKEVLWRGAQALAGDAEVVSAAVEAAWQACGLPPEGGWVALDCARLSTQPLGLRRAVLRRAIRALSPGLRDIDFGAVERGLALLETPGSRRAELSHGWVVVREGGRLLIGSGEAPEPGKLPQMPVASLELNVPGEAHLGNGWVLSAAWSAPGAPWRSTPPTGGEQPENEAGLALETWIDGDQAGRPLTIRRPYPGERFAPLGMAGHTLKLSDFFTNQKIPARARRGWPVLLAGNDLAWVVGLRQAESSKVTPQTQRTIHLSLRRLSPGEDSID